MSTGKSYVKTYRPPDGSPPVVCIYTKPSLMKKLAAFLRTFDRPPQQLFLEFAFVEVQEDDVAQFRYKLSHPLLNTIYGDTRIDEEVRRAMITPVERERIRRESGARLPDELNPRL